MSSKKPMKKSTEEMSGKEFRKYIHEQKQQQDQYHAKKNRENKYEV